MFGSELSTISEVYSAKHFRFTGVRKHSILREDVVPVSRNVAGFQSGMKIGSGPSYPEILHDYYRLQEGKQNQIV